MVEAFSGVRVRVPAKINLALCVGPCRPDGFHDLATVFHAISLGDEVRAQARPDAQIVLTMAGRGEGEVACDQTNLAVRAATALRDRHGRADLGIQMHINKQIPVAGGMAGGSADGAGALVACNAVWGLGCSDAELSAIAADLGSDVPFSLMGGNALGTGRGERLTPLPGGPALRWVVAVARGGLSTPRIYRVFDEMVAAGRATASAEHPRELMAALARGTAAEIAGLLTNSLQAPALECLPALRETLEVGRQAGALAALVSGSGPSCVFLVDDDSQQNAVVVALSQLDQVKDILTATGPVSGPRAERLEA